MLYLPLWITCSCCSHAFDCPYPFPSVRDCPLTNVVAGQQPLRLHRASMFDPEYRRLLNRDLRAASLYQRWLRSLGVSREDFLHLRSLLVSGSNHGEPAMWLLRDMLRPEIESLQLDYQEYYGASADDIQDSIGRRFPETVQHLSPELLAEAEGRGSNWGRCLIDSLRQRVWQDVGWCYVITDYSDEARLRALVEQQISRLLPFADSLYNFRVVPVISPRDMLAYGCPNFGGFWLLPTTDGALTLPSSAPSVVKVCAFDKAGHSVAMLAEN